MTVDSIHKGISPAEFTPVRPATLVAGVHDQLRSAILNGSIAMGSPIKDSVVAAEMKVSRAPVREALRLLEQSGLVEKTPNKPHTVKHFSQGDLLDLAILRIAVETTAARLIVRQQRDLSSIDAALATLLKVSRRGSVPDIAASDRDLHTAIVSAAGAPSLTSTYGAVRDQMTLALLLLEERSIPRFEGNAERHSDLVATLHACVLAGDATRIGDLLIEHIKSGMGCPQLVY